MDIIKRQQGIPQPRRGLVRDFNRLEENLRRDRVALVAREEQSEGFRIRLHTVLDIFQVVEFLFNDGQ